MKFQFQKKNSIFKDIIYLLNRKVIKIMHRFEDYRNNVENFIKIEKHRDFRKKNFPQSNFMIKCKLL